MNEEQNQETEPQSPPPAEGPTGPAAAIEGKVASCTGKVDALVNQCLGFVENHPWENWLAAANGFIGKFLPLVIGLAGAIAFAVGLVTSIRYDLRFSAVLSNVGILVATLFAMHLAPKAMALSRSFIEKREPDAMRPELLYILKVLLGLGGFFLAILLLIQFDGDALVMAIVVAVLAAFATIIFSHPALIGVKADYPENVVEETVTILLLPLKIVLSLLTIVVGVASVLLLASGVVQLFDNGMEASFTLLGAALAPFVVPLGVYVFYLLGVFILDFYRAIVSLPRKLDKLNDTIESK